MPLKEDVESFNQDLIRTGREPEVARKRGEEIERVLTPEEYPMDHNGPLTKVRRAAPTPEPESPTEAEAGEAGVSADDFLAGLGDEPKAPAGESFDDLFDTDDEPSQPAATEAPKAEAAFEDLFDDDVLGSIQAPIEPAEEPPNQLTDESETEPAAAEPSASATDDFNIMDDLADLTAQAPPKETGEESGDLGDFNLDDPFKDLETPAAEEEASEDSADVDNFLDNFETTVADEAGSASEELASADEAPAATDAPDDDFGFDTNLDFDSPLDEAPAAGESEIADEGPPDELAETGDLDAPLPEDEDLGSFDNVFEDPAAGSTDEESSEASVAAKEGETLPDIATDLDAEFGTEDFPEEFSMDDFGKKFGVMDEVETKDWQAPKLPAQDDEALEEAARARTVDEARDFAISDADFKRVQESLAAMPLNLKVATEEVLGNTSKPFGVLKPIIEALINGDSPEEIAPLVSKASGKRIRVPPGYQKRSGLSFEEEQNTFAYRFRHNILPMVGLVSLVILAAGIAGIVIYRFVVVPIIANNKYDQGLEAIQKGEYEAAEKTFFKEAYELWPDNNRFVQYAEAYTAKKANKQANDKYRDLLGDIDPRVLPVHLPDEVRQFYLAKMRQLAELAKQPRGVQAERVKEIFKVGAERTHRDGILKYADFLAHVQYEHEPAVIYLERLIQTDKPDGAAILLQGDIYLEWARKAEKPNAGRPADKLVAGTEMYTSDAQFPLPSVKYLDDSKRIGDYIKELYEGARVDYARLIAGAGPTDFLVSKMLRYFIRTGNSEQVDKIKSQLLASDKLKVDAAAVAELAGILIDKSQGSQIIIDQARKITRNALDGGSEDPNLFYQLARAEHFNNDLHRESDLLSSTLLSYKNLEAKRTLNVDEFANYIDAMIRKGENSFALQKDLDATERFQEAARRYEQALEIQFLPARSALYGRVYHDLADIKYYKKPDAEGYNEARDLYLQAIKNQYGEDPAKDGVVFNRPSLSANELWEAYQDTSYKLGYIAYKQATSTLITDQERATLQQDALKHFLRAQGRSVSDSFNLRLALAATSYQTGNYENAVGIYRQLYEQLRMERTELQPFDPQNRISHAENQEARLQVTNNLGASLLKLAQNGGPYAEEYLSKARAYLVESTQIRQSANIRDETGLPTQTTPAPLPGAQGLRKPLAKDPLSSSAYNLNAAVGTYADKGEYVYTDIPKDLGSGTLSRL